MKKSLAMLLSLTLCAGLFAGCSNSGSVNTKDLEDDPKTDYTNLAQINSMENVPAYTDVGGVAGYSKGTIQSCSNSGSVGYDQIGYNIGGIAGRSTGWLDGCVNTGSVSGRSMSSAIASPSARPSTQQTYNPAPESSPGSTPRHSKSAKPEKTSRMAAMESRVFSVE